MALLPWSFPQAGRGRYGAAAQLGRRSGRVARRQRFAADCERWLGQEIVSLATRSMRVVGMSDAQSDTWLAARPPGHSRSEESGPLGVQGMDMR